jgi:hypothetical protein
LIKVLPSSASFKSKKFGSLLLHWVCKFKPPSFVSIIAAAHPAAVSEMCGDVTLLHWAVVSQASVELIQVLVKACPSAARKTCGGKLALHHAVELGSSVEIVGCLLEAFPGAIQAKAGQGNTAGLPLHLACRPDSRATIATVRKLLEVDPLAAKVRDGDGKLPLRFCYEWDASQGMIDLLHDAYPEALS